MGDGRWVMGGWVMDNGLVHVVHKVPIARISPRYLSKALELPSFHHWTIIFLSLFVLFLIFMIIFAFFRTGYIEVFQE